MGETRVVACRHAICSKCTRVREEPIKLDRAVAHDVWIGRAAGLVSLQQRLEDIVPVLTHEGDAVEADA